MLDSAYALHFTVHDGPITRTACTKTAWRSCVAGVWIEPQTGVAVDLDWTQQRVESRALS